MWIVSPLISFLNSFLPIDRAARSIDHEEQRYEIEENGYSLTEHQAKYAIKIILD